MQNRRSKSGAICRLTRSSVIFSLLAISAMIALPNCKTSDATSQTVVSTAPALPPAICKAHVDLPASDYFTEVTSDVGLDGIIGIRVSSADLDGDGLPDLVFHSTGDVRDNPATSTYLRRVFMNKGGTFVDTTATSGLFDSRDGPNTGRLGHLSIFADVDNDGDMDMYEAVYSDGLAVAPATDDRSEILLNDGTGHFTFAPRSGPSAKVLPFAAASFADFDKDGIVDLFATTWYNAANTEGDGSYLYMGDGTGSFGDVSTASGLLRKATGGTINAMMSGTNRKPAYGATACDIDNDGDQDIIVSSYGRSYNELWRNDGGKFTEIGFGTPFAADSDLNYQDNEFYHCYCQQNVGKCPTTVPAPLISCTDYSWTPGVDDQPPRLAGNNFSSACADMDNDGDLDVIHAGIKHWHIGESSDTTQILQNTLDTGTLGFTRLANSSKTLQQPHATSDWNEGDIVVGAFDFDNDGKKDVYLGSSDYPDTYGWLYHQNDDGTFTNVTDTAGVKHYHAVAFTAVDIDGDGDLDLVVATSGMRCSGDPKCPATYTAKVYRNLIGDQRNFVKVRLHGAGAGGSNMAGIGARVTVTAGGVTQTQEVNGGYGTFGMQHDTILTFGLGDACAVDSITVTWPNANNTVDTFTAVLANYLVDVTENQGMKYLALTPNGLTDPLAPAPGGD